MLAYSIMDDSNKKTVPIRIRLNSVLLARLKQLAKENNLTLSELIRKMIDFSLSQG